MTDLLVKLFIKDPDNVEDEKTRLAYGILSSITGIVCNIFLFFIKVVAGFLMNSIAVISDGFNNLSDCMSCLITMFGYKLASKPADKEHPFGHGRMEYIVSFVVSIIIFVVTFQLFVESVKKIFSPEVVHFSMGLFLLLLASILVKLWMSVFNTKLGKKLNNIVMLTTAKDSRNDVLTTAISLLAMILSSYFTHIPFDGIFGVVLSCFLFYSGYEIAKDIITRLLGTPADPELTEQITKQILSHSEIMGVHDMIIHDYGPGSKIGSAHAEVDSHMDFVKAHDVIDTAENEIQNHLHVMMTLHLDPVDVSNPEINAYHKEIQAVLDQLNCGLSMHDFRMVSGVTHTNLVFDVVYPFECKYSTQEIKDAIDKIFEGREKKIYTVIHFDRGFVQEEIHE